MAALALVPRTMILMMIALANLTVVTNGQGGDRTGLLHHLRRYVKQTEYYFRNLSQ